MTQRKSEVWYDSFESAGEVGGRIVHEDADAGQAKPTGVLNRHGNMICREPERIGFRPRK